VAPSRMVGVSASVNLPLHHKVQKFSSGTGLPGWSRKRAGKWLWCGVVVVPSNCALKLCTGIDRVKWCHISVVAIRLPFCRSRPSYCA